MQRVTGWKADRLNGWKLTDRLNHWEADRLNGWKADRPFERLES
jgi:hypothetical protein